MANLLDEVKQGIAILNDPHKTAVLSGALGGAASVQFQTLESKFQEAFGTVQKKLGPFWPGNADSVIKTFTNELKPPTATAPGISAYLLGGIALILAVLLVVRR